MSTQLPLALSHPQDWDRATQSNYTEIKVTHTHLEWTIDWAGKVFHGKAIISLKAVKDVQKITLDTSYLDIQKVKLEGKEVKWELGDRIGTIGNALSFNLPGSLKAGQVSDTQIPLEP